VNALMQELLVQRLAIVLIAVTNKKIKEIKKEVNNNQIMNQLTIEEVRIKIE
jgi:hypothetical protein